MRTLRHRCAFTFLLSLLLLPFDRLQAQRGGSSPSSPGGGHTIEIHVLNPEGAALHASVRVDVLTAGGLQLAQAYSNREEGVADFEGFSDGFFQARVSGPEIETLTLTFQIPATEATHREYVRVDLKNRNADPGFSPGEDQTVSAQDFSIPRRARDAFARAMEAHAKGDDRAAQSLLQRAIEVYPSYVKAHNNLGVLYQAEGQQDKAFVEYSKAVQFDPKFVPGYINLARISVARQNLAEAEPVLKKAVAADPSSVTALVLLCSTQFARREYEGSLAAAARVHQLTRDAQYADVHLVAGKILVVQRKLREAISQYQMFLTERPSDPRSEKIKSLVAELASR